MKIKFECKQCKKEFNDTKSHHPVLFCSNKCRNNFRRNKTWEELFGIEKANHMKIFSNKHKEKISKSLIGKFKGKTYEEIMGEKRAKERKEQNKKRMIGKNNPFYNKKHSDTTKKLMSSLKLNKTHEEIMGIENSQKWKERMSGKNSPLWKGGYSIKDYKNFTKKIKNYIRKRDNQVCMMCGKHREKMDTALSVHHIDYNKHNSVPENCVALCFDCHAKTNYNRKHWISFFQSLLTERYDYNYKEVEYSIV